MAVYGSAEGGSAIGTELVNESGGIQFMVVQYRLECTGVAPSSPSHWTLLTQSFLIDQESLWAT